MTRSNTKADARWFSVTRRSLRTTNRSHRSRRVSRVPTWWLLGVVCLLVMGGVGYQFVEPVLADWTTIRHISISGTDHIQQEDILSRLHLSGEATLLNIDRIQLLEQVEAHPWVASATVGRVLPDILTIVIHERRPSAILRNQENRLLIDDEGFVLSHHMVSAYNHLPVLEGLNATLMLNEDPLLRQRARHGILLASWIFKQFQVRPVINMKDPQDMIVTVHDLQFRFNSSFEAQWKRYHALETSLSSIVTTGRREIDLRFPGKVIVRPRG